MLKKLIENLKRDFSKNIQYKQIKKFNQCEKFDLIKKCYNIDNDEYNEQNVIKAYITFFNFGRLDVKTKNSKVFVDGNEVWIEGFNNYNDIVLPRYLFVKTKHEIKEFDLTEINENLIKKCN